MRSITSCRIVSPMSVAVFQRVIRAHLWSVNSARTARAPCILVHKGGGVWRARQPLIAVPAARFSRWCHIHYSRCSLIVEAELEHFSQKKTVFVCSFMFYASSSNFLLTISELWKLSSPKLHKNLVFLQLNCNETFHIITV